MSKNNRLNKYAVSTIAAAAAVTAVAPVAASADTDKNFSDISKDGVHYDAIMSLAEKGIVDGDEAGEFNPWDTVVRGQIAKMMVNAKNLDIPENIEEVLSVYDDVDSSNDHAEEIAAVTEAGIMEGDSDNAFNEYSDMSRDQMASILVRAFDLDEIEAADVDIDLDDAEPAHEDAIQTIANLEITDQLDAFHGTRSIARGAFASMLDRTLNVVEADKDTEAPTINIPGENTITVENGEELDLPEVTATDNEDKEIDVDSVITDSEGNEIDEIDTTEAGTYTVTYTAEDEAGNEATSTITVEVAETSEDTEAPNINIPGESTITVGLNDDVGLPNVTATDNEGESVEVTTEFYDSDRNKVDEIDTTEAGTYTVAYTAEDEAGNKATAAITVEVRNLVDNSSELEQAIAEADDTITLVDDIELNDELVIDRGVTIDGNGHQVNDAVNITADHVTVKDLTIDLPESESTALNVEHGATEATIKDNIIDAEGNLAIYFNRESSGSVLNNQITASRKGIGAQTNGEVTIQDNTITATDTAVELFVDDQAEDPDNDGSNYSVSNNTFENDDTVVRPN